MSKLIVVLGIILAVGAGGVHAAPRCDDFKAALIEGAAKYQIPNPTFELAQDNNADSDITVWNIATFKELPTMMICSHGSVSTFAVYANAITRDGLRPMMPRGIPPYIGGMSIKMV